MATDEEKQRLTDAIAAACANWGYGIVGWEEDEDGIYADLGTGTVEEDDDINGVFGGDSGTLRAQVVGSQKYNSERVAFLLLIEGTDEPVEVDPGNLGF